MGCSRPLDGLFSSPIWSSSRSLEGQVFSLDGEVLEYGRYSFFCQYAWSVKKFQIVFFLFSAAFFLSATTDQDRRLPTSPAADADRCGCQAAGGRVRRLARWHEACFASAGQAFSSCEHTISTALLCLPEA